MVSRCLVFFLLSADASQYTPKKSHSASMHWRGEVKGISHTRMPQLRRSSKMAGLGKHEMREGGRAFKPGAWDDKDGTRTACWQAKASSFDFHSSSVKAN